MATLLQDNFDRADSTTSPGSPQVGGPYTAVTGTWGINANQLYISASTTYSTITFPAAYNVDVSITVAAGNGGAIIRYISDTSYWVQALATGANPHHLLYRKTGATALSQYLDLGPAVVGDVVRVVGYGDMIYCLVNGVMKGSVRDQWASSAPTVAGFYINGGTTGRLDNALAQDATGIPGGVDGSPSFVYRGRDTATLDTGAA